MEIFLYECYTKTVINPRTYHETICVMFKLFLNVVKVAFNLFLEVAYVNCIKRIHDDDDDDDDTMLLLL